MQVTVGNDPKDCVILYWADADFAGWRTMRKSATGGIVMLDLHMIKAWSSAPANISLSSGEAE